MPGNDHDYDDPKPKYNQYQKVGVGNERVTILDIHELTGDETVRSYDVIYPDGTEDTHTEDELDEMAAMEGDYETDTTGSIKQYTREGFGKVDVRATETSGHPGISYSLAAQGASESLDPFEARLLAHALRQAGPALELLINDDPLEVASAFENAADAIEAYQDDQPDDQ